MKRDRERSPGGAFLRERTRPAGGNIPLSGLPFPLKRQLLFGVVRHDQRIVFEQVVAVDLHLPGW